MVNFGQNYGLTRENVNLSTFRSSCLYSQERRFFILEYHKTHFPGLYCLKKKLEKLRNLDQNHGLTLLEKVNFFLFQLYLSIALKFFPSRKS